MSSLKNKLNAFDVDKKSFLGREDVKFSLKGIYRGIERETVRTTSFGLCSSLLHPKSLGSALMHPYITTDFAEAQLELVTPPLNDRATMFETLEDLHHVVAMSLPSNEVLWGASMPPILPNDEDIMVADYGLSHAGHLKMRYRQGLATRYGKRMQLISGIHYNFSLPETFWKALHQETKSSLVLHEFITERYFHLIRNVLRHGWIIPYLFGVSPAVDSSYLKDTEIKNFLKRWDRNTDYLPWATSLRLSDIGYCSAEQLKHPVCFNSKETYLADLYRLLTKQSQSYAHLGKDKQLNASILQMESELYGSIRPKVVSKEQRPFMALSDLGVQYIELRSIDNNPYLPFGINEAQSQFLDVFLTYCALALSPPMSDREQKICAQRQALVSSQGRKPELTLPTLEEDVTLALLGEMIMNAMLPIADMFDSAVGGRCYFDILQAEKRKFKDSSLTPSAKILKDMQVERLGHTELVQKLSLQQMNAHLERSISPDKMKTFMDIAEKSLLDQERLENQQSVGFSEFLQRYSAFTYQNVTSEILAASL